MTLSRILSILIIVAIGPIEGFAAAVWLTGQELQAQLVADTADGQLDEFDFLSAALVAGGINNTDLLREYRRLLLDRCTVLLEQEGLSTNRAEVLFEFLHKQLLTGKYHVEYTAPSRVLDEGHYNCVSATILYHWLCEQCGLDSTIVATRDHVLVRLPSALVQDVETTCPEWFALPSRREVRLEAGRPISRIQLLGKVFYNRAVCELDEQNFSQAIHLLRISLALDPEDGPALENLLAAINNWSLVAAESGNFELAGELLEEGRQINPAYAPLLVNDVHVHQQWAAELCRLGRYAQAINLLEAGYRRRDDTPLFDSGRLAIYRLWAEALFSEGRNSEARDVLEAARARHAGDCRWPSYEAAALERAASVDLTKGQS